MNQQFDVAAFRSALDRVPRRLRLTWPQLVRALTTFRVFPGLQDKRRLPAWAPVRYRDGATRGAAGVEAVSLLVLDYDGGTAIDDACRAWADWPHVLHTSWSHTPDAPRFRLVLPLEEPVPAQHWPAAWRWAEQLARERGTTPDPACKDVGRMYFRPAIRAGGWPHEARVHEGGGRCLRLELASELRQPPARPHRRPRGPVSVSWRRRQAVLRAVLAEDADARRWAAEALGMQVRGAVARCGPCPQCGRRDVWWPIDPRRPMGGRCNHRDSCGWRGSLLDVLDAAGVDADWLIARADVRGAGTAGAGPGAGNSAPQLRISPCGQGWQG